MLTLNLGLNYIILYKAQHNMERRTRVPKPPVSNILKPIQKEPKLKQKKSSKVKPKRGRPKTSQSSQKDDKFSEAVVRILEEYIQYTEKLGLKHGFFLSNDFALMAQQTDQNEVEGMKNQDMINLIQMTRSVMDRKAANQFESLYKQSYNSLKLGRSNKQVVEMLANLIHEERPSQYQIINFTWQGYDEEIRKETVEVSIDLLKLISTIVDEIHKILKNAI